MPTTAVGSELQVNARGRASRMAAPLHEPHVDALTGVRALAAGWVVAYHLWLNAGQPALIVPGFRATFTPLVAVGWLGVDIFFILSGFVLTRQALHEHVSTSTRSGSTTPSIPQKRESGVVPAHFWRDAGVFLRRRILRVYPAYLASLTVLLPLAWLGVYRMPPTLGDIALHLVMFHNLVAGYVDSINGVYWSMPFEWQFYLLFPLLVIAVLRGRTRWLLAAAIAVALAMKLWSALAGPGAEFAQFPWRVDEFVVGMAAAAFAVRMPQASSVSMRLTWIAMASLVAGAWITGARDSIWWQPGVLPFARAAWIDITIALLLIGLCGTAGGIARLFATRPMVWLGTISYSIYLWHLPTLQLTREALLRHFGDLPRIVEIAIPLVVIIIVSALSYYLVERPFHGPSRDASKRWRDPRFRLKAVLAWIGALFVGAACIAA